MMNRRYLTILICALSVLPRGLMAQQTTCDTLTLSAVQQLAAAADPRVREINLQSRATDLRVRNIKTESLPSLSFEGFAQHQSDVVTFPTVLPQFAGLIHPPHNTFDAYLRVQQSVY